MPIQLSVQQLKYKYITLYWLSECGGVRKPVNASEGAFFPPPFGSIFLSREGREMVVQQLPLVDAGVTAPPRLFLPCILAAMLEEIDLSSAASC